ncbi:hypothetical protein SO694_00071191 [Aureococcus anophagefferens]|uniref:Uncharacterized protein n=1 Tax=Aureococcus anophagefferens TaxID=44056 RepID=A0ABR1FI41_AURAN
MVARQAEFDALMAHCPDSDGLRKSLTDLWADPPVAAMAARVPSCACADEARRLLFFPSASDGGAYARLVAPKKPGAAERSPARPALGLMFMLHRESGFLRRFVVAGGLDHLAARLTEGDLHVRAHAVEVFLRITGDPDLRWYDAPRRGSEDAALHAALLAMDGGASPFFEGLAANRRDSFPGGERSCLDLLAFWIGWARQTHCEGMRMGLSRDLLATLSDWVPCAQSRGDPEEEALAKQLFDDFSRFPPHSGADGEACGGVALRDVGDDDDDEVCGDEPVVDVAADATDVSGAVNRPAVAVLLCNRSTCLFKLGEASLAHATFDSRARECFEACADECAAALEADPRNVKAHYRRAQALEKLGPARIFDAIDAARAAKAGLGRGAPPPQRNAIEKLLLDLLKRPAASAGAGGSAAAKKVSKTSKILQSLVRARDGTSQHEMLGKWTDAKAAQFKEKDRTPAERRAAAADELDRDAPELSAGLDGTEESKGGEAPATSDDDEPAAALVDADADSDDDDAMEIRARDAAAAKSAKKAKAKAKEAKKENGRKPKDADVKKKKQADKLAKILGMSHA